MVSVLSRDSANPFYPDHGTARHAHLTDGRHQVGEPAIWTFG